MKKYFYILIASLVLLSFSKVNDFHTSTTKVELNSGSTSMTFSSKFVTEDLVKAVGTGIENQSAFNSAVERYLKNNFIVKINGSPKALNFAQAQTSPKATRIYFEIPNVSDVSSIEIKNTMLFDVFSDQQNFITLNINDKRDNFVTKPGSATGKSTF